MKNWKESVNTALLAFTMAIANRAIFLILLIAMARYDLLDPETLGEIVELMYF